MSEQDQTPLGLYGVVFTPCVYPSTGPDWGLKDTCQAEALLICTAEPRHVPARRFPSSRYRHLPWPVTSCPVSRWDTPLHLRAEKRLFVALASVRACFWWGSCRPEWALRLVDALTSLYKPSNAFIGSLFSLMKTLTLEFLAGGFKCAFISHGAALWIWFQRDCRLQIRELLLWAVVL